MRKSVVWMVAFFVACPALTRADDASSGVPLPGARSRPAGSVKGQAASVRLGQKTITVNLAINTSGAPNAALRWEIPPFGWVGASDPYPDRQFPELTVAIDGDPAHLVERVDAFAGDRNISGLLDAARLDAWSITETPPLVNPQAGDSSAWNALEALGAVQKSDGAYVANWTAGRTLDVRLKPLVKQRVRWSYTARPAYALIRAGQIATPLRKARYCLSSEQVSQLVGGDPDRLVSVVEYDIPVGIDDKPPRSLTLRATTFDRRAGHGPGSIFVCAFDRKPVTSKSRLEDKRVAFDLHGVLHVMKVDDAGAQ